MSLAMLLLCKGHLFHAEESVSISYIRIADRHSNYCTCNTHDATKTPSSISNHPVTGNCSLHQTSTTQVLEDPWARHIVPSMARRTRSSCSHSRWMPHATFRQHAKAGDIYTHATADQDKDEAQYTDTQLPFSGSITDAISAS